MTTTNTPPDNLSQGTCRVRAWRFVENGAGVYTGSLTLPANALILDIIVNAEALWTAATSAVLNVGDATDDDGFFTAVDLKATDLLAGESISFVHSGTQQGADVDFIDTGAEGVAVLAGGPHVRRRRLTTSRVVSATVTSVGAGTAGRTEVYVHYAVPVEVEVTQ